MFVWTGALAPGYRQRSRDEVSRFPFVFTAAVPVELHPRGTKYTALAIHADEAGGAQHAEVGFHQGRGATLDQLVALARRM
jgi:hypothetical protein